MKTTLPTDSNERKSYPMFRGALRYFPFAIAIISWISKRGNDKHNPGEPMHHARGKSSDHGDCILRHLTDVEDIIAAHVRADKDAKIDREKLQEELGQLGWRTCAYIQEIGEQYLNIPLAPGAMEPSGAASPSDPGTTGR